MDMPDWFVWIALGLFVSQGLALVRLGRRMRGLDPSARRAVRLDFVEGVGAMLLFASLTGSLLWSDAWGVLALVGFVVMAGVNVVKGVHWLRARRGQAA
ncbi:hypothetical protein [Streptomyces sp. NPDC048659]|uniref:hypothetical protein n=1 Tax=Streptomyces sp. NPDC048659 TaxID=3155489 RepID=UPI00343786B4